MSITEAEIEQKLRPYAAPQSMDRLRPHFPSWIARLNAWGIESVSTPNVIEMLALEATSKENRRAKAEVIHNLHDMVSCQGLNGWTRRYKG